ncbi:ParH-like protein [Kitasatospora sp. McL0602]|uniref:ParH-like protein n=1 Tax=Kitasatospora sp. McL0602 TaxID=3439530 RepID=UPI003F8C2020
MAATLTLPEPFELAELTRALSERMGRPVEFIPLPAGSFGPCGVLVSTDQAEYIGYPADTTPLHQRHIVLHEVGHLLCGHQGGAGLGPGVTETLLPHLSGQLVRRVLGRDAYTEVQEREAELFASLVMHRVSLGGGPVAELPVAQPGGEADTVARLGSFFDVPRHGA